jgi:ABC transport system ATP-binding/permease protein
MSERILKALMQMFAIIARVDGISDSGRRIVQLFLKQQLNQEQVEQYLRIFDEYLEAHHQISKRKDGSEKRTSLNSVKVLKICTEINKELEQAQKVVVLVRLLEFIHSSDEISEQELEFATTVSETFNIPVEEFNNLKFFVEDKKEIFKGKDEFLFINNRQEQEHSIIRYYRCDQFSADAEVVVMKLTSVNMYVLKLIGEMELLLNGQALFPGRIYIFTPGSSLRSAKVKPIYYSDIIGRFLSDVSKHRLTFTASHLEYKFKSGKIGLRDISIGEEGGRLVGIMGGSGAGKSTLLNVLNGNDRPSSGEVCINGINIHTNKQDVEGVIGHVSQDDLLIEELTVFQNLFFNARLCFGTDSEQRINEKVIKTLTDLGLYETRDLKVGSPLEKTISGGQRKRLNIALELIREPSVLFVDEPTSGLSSRDSENIMDLLKELSLKGKLIFVVIHQPSSEIYKMFDKMLILDVGGYPIFYGNPVDAVIYFKRLIHHVKCEESECELCGNVNPEQIFNIIETKVLDEYGHHTPNRKHSPAEWSNYYREQIESGLELAPHETTKPEKTLRIPGWFSQLKIFIQRDVLSKLANTQYVLINFLEAPLLAFILAFLVRYYNTDEFLHHGYIFGENENVPAYLFMAVVVALFIGLTVSAEEIIKDRKIRKREKFLNLSNSSYLMSKVVILFVLSAIQTLMFVLIGNSILGIKAMWFDYWLVLFSVSCFANMLGLNVSSAFNSAITIYICC